MPPFRWSNLAVALCVCAVLLPGCHRKNAARRTLGTTQDRPVAVVGDTNAPAGSISRVSVALHSGPEGKDPSEIVTARIVHGSDVVGESIVGSGEAWAPGALRALEIPLNPALPLSEARNMRLEISKSTPDGLPGRPWTVSAEALGQLTDGRVVRLMDLSPAMAIGGNNPFRRSWPLAPR
jgi:hypothetical protein